MKKVLSLVMLGLIGVGGIIGCETSVKVDDNDHDGTYYKKTTVREPDGDRTVKTEIRRD